MGSVIGAIAIVIASFIRRERDKYQDVCVATGLSLFWAMAIAPLSLSTIIRVHTLDLALLRADSLLGLDPMAFVRLISRHPWASTGLTIAYNNLPFAFAIAYIATRSRVMVRAMVIGGLAAYPFYNLVPAVGPKYAFASFPFSADVANHTLTMPRNCFPSLHLGWAILIAFNLRGTWARVIGWTFVGITAAATIALGQHYYVDLIASVPFCFAVQRAAQWMEDSKATIEEVEA
jgi:hypothetical protein